MRKYRLNDLKLRYKLFLLHLLISLPIIAISAFFLRQSVRDSYGNMRDLSYVTVQQLADNISGQFEELYNISERLLAEGSVRKYVSTAFERPYDSYSAYVGSIKPILDVMTLFRSDVSIEIYSDNPMIMFSSDTSQTLEDLSRRAWYRQGEFTSRPTWLVESEDAYHVRDNAVGFYRMMRLPPSHVGQPRYTMALAVMMPEASIYALLAGNAAASQEIFVYRQDGTVVCSTDRDAIFGTMGDRALEAFTLQDAPLEQRIAWNGEEYLAIRRALDVPAANISGWNILYMVPIRQLNRKSATLLRFSLALCVACMAISMLATHAVANNMLARIRRLSATIQNAWNERFYVQTEITGTDEIGVLESNFNAMMQKIDLLRDEVFQTSLKFREAELQHNQALLEKREAEISALSAQINPHFLFNTLEAIKMNLLLRHNTEETASILDVFAENFRFFIDTSTDMVPLRDELHFLRNYTAIQKYSYGDTLRYQFSISQLLLEDRLPKLLLQPLVENALYHGIAPKGGGVISISIQPADKGCMEIRVSDDGVGMDEVALANIRASLESAQPLNAESGKRIALSNISRRLKLVYEGRAEMRIESVLNAGTQITIRLPRESAEKE